MSAPSEEVIEKVDTAIAKMADQAKSQPDAQKSLHYSQAALNLAHTKSILIANAPKKESGKAAKSE